jgi:hypothetical protein
MPFFVGPFPLMFSFTLMPEIYGLLLSESRQDKDNNGQIDFESYNSILRLTERPPVGLWLIVFRLRVIFRKGPLDFYSLTFVEVSDGRGGDL